MIKDTQRIIKKQMRILLIGTAFIVVSSILLSFFNVYFIRTFYVKDVNLYITIERLENSIFRVSFSKDKDKPGKDYINYLQSASDLWGPCASFKPGNNDTIFVYLPESSIIGASESAYKFKISKHFDSRYKEANDITIGIYPMDQLNVWRDSVYLGEAPCVKSE